MKKSKESKNLKKVSGKIDSIKEGKDGPEFVEIKIITINGVPLEELGIDWSFVRFYKSDLSDAILKKLKKAQSNGQTVEVQYNENDNKIVSITVLKK
ncbi:hypothetical protein [Kordia sp.]|uniref:hypothetical protein n=1 Tax=Kordia sp. TaxID=1965332 RepID=UPI003D6BDF84